MQDLRWPENLSAERWGAPRDRLAYSYSSYYGIGVVSLKPLLRGRNLEGNALTSTSTYHP